LFIKGYEAVGGKGDEIIDTSICVELLEAYLLIHDDIIDQDKMRRGGFSFHEMTAKWKGDPHFGLSSAIIAGNLLNGLAIQVLIEAPYPQELKMRALTEFINAEINCFHGELYDVILERIDATENDLMRMIDLKTASYTTKAPLIMGAILGNGSEKQIKILSEYGGLLGCAFQIIDDILGTFGDEEILGKPVTSDIEQGKKTLLLVYALDKVKGEELRFLKKCIGTKNISSYEFSRIKEIFEKSGALSYSQNKAAEYVKRAKLVLNLGDFDNESKMFLEELADFVIKRKY
jgi:geranylgeranyl diphosphate synthase type I